jgi:peptide/nickel transport system permease protein
VRRPAGRVLGVAGLAAVGLAALLAPVLAPQSPSTQFADYVNAPPMRIRLVDREGRWRAPFVYPLRLADRLERRYDVDLARPVALEWFAGGRLVRLPDHQGPLLLLGADSLGRDLFARLLYGARVSLGVALVGAVGALAVGLLVGALAGYTGGIVGGALMHLTDFVLVLPTVYVMLALRAALPLVLEPSQLFVAMAGLLALVGWPYTARGVRAIVALERQREYVLAARSLGAGHLRILFRHLLPATREFLVAQTTLLLPAFILAEATLSYVGLGFAEPTPSWGTMLAEATTSPVALTQFPWLLAPAGAIVLVVLAVHAVLGSRVEQTTFVGLGPR